MVNIGMVLFVVVFSCLGYIMRKIVIKLSEPKGKEVRKMRRQ